MTTASKKKRSVEDQQFVDITMILLAVATRILGRSFEPEVHALQAERLLEERNKLK